MNFRKWLAHKITEKGFNPSQMTYRAGLSHSEVSRLLSGKRDPSLKTLMKISKTLNIRLRELLEQAGYIEPIEGLDEKDLTYELLSALKDPQAKKALLLIHNADPETKKVLFDICTATTNLPKEKMIALQILIKNRES
jgi:transcriptional regulator with XRE-family HTH domain